MTWWKVSQHSVMGRQLPWLLRIVLDGHVRTWWQDINPENKRSLQHLSEETEKQSLLSGASHSHKERSWESYSDISDLFLFYFSILQCWLWARKTQTYVQTTLLFLCYWIPRCFHTHLLHSFTLLWCNNQNLQSRMNTANESLFNSKV